MEKSTRIISVVGKKNSGKTTLIVALSQEMTRKGRRVAVIKHGSHPAQLDVEGTDTYRHFNEGRAERVLIESPANRAYFERTSEQSDPLTLARSFMPGTDIVFVEGFTQSELPKIEVFRRGEHRKPRYSDDVPNAARWIAIVSDGATLEVPFSHFRFSDTGLLVTLSALAWDKALVLDH